VVFATLMGQLDRFDLGAAGWAFDLFAHFPRHLAITGFMVAAFAAALRLWKPAALSAAVAIVNAALVVTVSGHVVAQPAAGDGQMIRIVSSNVHGSVEALQKLSGLAREYEAELISVYEAPALSDAEMQAIFPGATISAIRQSPDGRELSKRMLIVSMLAIAELEIAATGGRSNRAVLRYRPGDRSIQIVAAHPVSPDSPAGMRDRNRMLSSLANDLDQAAPFIVMGPFLLRRLSWASPSITLSSAAD
jgi:endonuclease/exonuclease/phosphatase (EEP) superfamily protein YafD